MKALSIKQPWAWAILHAGKDVENRTWSTRYRGRFFVHAGKGLDREGLAWLRSQGVPVPHENDLPRGGVLGTVELVDCVDRMDSAWFFGPWGFVLRDPVVYGSIVPCKGQLGFFDPPQEEAPDGNC